MKDKSIIKEKLKLLLQLFSVFFKIGLISFGGGYGMIPIIEREVVEKKKWLTPAEMMNILAIAESTPGPISVNTATFAGTKMAGILGGLIATIAMILPCFLVIISISFVLDEFKENVWIGYAFAGIRAAVIVLVFHAVIKFFKQLEKTIFAIIIMLSTFALAFLSKIDIIFIILGVIAISIIYFSILNGKNKNKEIMLESTETNTINGTENKANIDENNNKFVNSFENENIKIDNAIENLIEQDTILESENAEIEKDVLETEKDKISNAETEQDIVLKKETDINIILETKKDINSSKQSEALEENLKNGGKK